MSRTIFKLLKGAGFSDEPRDSHGRWTVSGNGNPTRTEEHGSYEVDSSVGRYPVVKYTKKGSKRSGTLNVFSETIDDAKQNAEKHHQKLTNPKGLSFTHQGPDWEVKSGDGKSLGIVLRHNTSQDPTDRWYARPSGSNSEKGPFSTRQEAGNSLQ